MLGACERLLRESLVLRVDMLGLGVSGPAISVEHTSSPALDRCVDSRHADNPVINTRAC